MKYYTSISTVPAVCGIYILHCPETKKQMYVGQSKNIKKRYSSHLNGALTSTPKDKWIYELQNRGLEPILSIHCQCEARDLEREEINLIKYIGIDNLLNVWVGSPKGFSKKTKEPWNHKKSPMGFLSFAAKCSLPKTTEGNKKRKDLDIIFRDLKKSGRWYLANAILLKENEFVSEEFEGKIDYRALHEMVKIESGLQGLIR